MKISILTPTRQRPDNARSFAESVLATARDPDNIELLFYVDQDDPKLREYSNWHLVCPKQVHIYIGIPQSISKSWNVIADRATGDIFIMGNDDVIYHTPSWDFILKNRLIKYADEIYLAWFDDGINSENHCAFPMVSRKWYNILGYFTPDTFEFLCNDSWLYDIGKKLDRLCYISDVYAEHKHFSTSKSKADQTTIRYRKSGATRRDLELFNKTVAQRDNDVEKLKKYML